MTDRDDDVKGESNVVDLNEKRAKKKEKKKAADAPEPPPEKIKKAALYEAIFNAITDTIGQLLPRPDFHIATVKLERRIKIPIKITGNEECERLDQEELESLFMNYLRTKLAGNSDFQFKPAEVKECIDYWRMASTPLASPRLVRFHTDPGTCWHRLPFNMSNEPTPTFDELFSRMTNSRAIKAWIGSLFIPESYDQQYVWIYGKGNDGKSPLLEFLARVYGIEGALVQSEAPGKDKHWAEVYLGKRLVYFPDFKDFSSLDNGPLKQLTGGDRIFVRPMFHPGFMTKLSCKLIFSSNHMPPSDLPDSTLRRLMFAEMRGTKNFASNYAHRLWSEGGAFLRSCIEVYGEMCPRHQKIEMSAESIEQLHAWGAHEDDEYQLWFDDFFEAKSGAYLNPNDLTKTITARFKDHKSKQKAYSWLHQKGFRRKQKRDGDNRFWTYPGLCLRDTFQSHPISY